MPDGMLPTGAGTPGTEPRPAVLTLVVIHEGGKQ
jgi:hypothetical protein